MLEIDKPFVSIIIPIFNEEALIAECLESLLEQDYPKECAEIIAVDNGSTDRSADVIQKFPVRYVLEKKRGAGAARNAGARQARGKFLAFIDSDCIASKTWISELVLSLEDGSSDAAGGDCRIIFGKSLIEDYLFYRGFYSQKEFFSFHHPFLPWLMTGNLMVRRDAFLKVGGFEETFLRGEDIDFSWLLIQNGAKLKYLPDLAVLHRRPASFSNFYLKHFKDGNAMALLQFRYGPLCRKHQAGKQNVSLIEKLISFLKKLHHRTNQIFLEKNGLSLFRRTAYYFLAFTSHLIFLSGKVLHKIRYGILRKPIPLACFSKVRDNPTNLWDRSEQTNLSLAAGNHFLNSKQMLNHNG